LTLPSWRESGEMVLGLRDLGQRPEESEFVSGVFLVATEDALHQMKGAVRRFFETEFGDAPPDAAASQRVFNLFRFPHNEADALEKQMKFWGW
jgi:hypothetical protein